MRHAKVYYRAPDGRQTSEVANYKPVLRRLLALYGKTLAADFGPLALKAVRQVGFSASQLFECECGRGLPKQRVRPLVCLALPTE